MAQTQAEFKPMTESMVERVARVLEPSYDVVSGFRIVGGKSISLDPEGVRKAARQKARAAISAMRVPTEAMVFECYGADHDPESIGETGRSYWRAMIDCALAEKPE